MSRALVAVSLLVVALPSAAPAHVGAAHDGTAPAVHVWTDPRTGHGVPASILFVEAGLVHVEDAAGVRRAWRLETLRPADRRMAEQFLQRARRFAGRAPASTARGTIPSGVWLLVAAGLGAVLVHRAGRGGQWLAHAGMAAAVGPLLIACGSSSPAGGDSVPLVTGPSAAVSLGAAGAGPDGPLPLASFFTSFPGHVRTRQDEQALYVESDGLADHVMMAGIRSWQQQVPLPADYTGANAWVLPLRPRLADTPVSARTGLFRGAIALAVNGVPIFNALNNRGDDAFLAGELDEFGGHAGRADDYHYHTAPLFLSSVVGATRPIAVALDGFPLYGSVEPDGSPMRPLDDYNGHAEGASGYHYHGTRSYPYINGGMKGVVRVSDQVEPQPAVRPVRPAGTPLAGAVVTRHAATGPASWRLDYTRGGGAFRVDYRIEGARVVFTFTDPDGTTRSEVYSR